MLLPVALSNIWYNTVCNLAMTDAELRSGFENTMDICWVILTNYSVFTVSILQKIGLIIKPMG